MHKIKICFISHSSEKGGAENALIELIDILKTWGIKAYVILPSYGPLIEELKIRDVEFHVERYYWWLSGKLSLPNRLWNNILNCINIVPIAIKIKKWKCDLVYSNTLTICEGAIAAKLIGLPHILHIHEFGYEDHGLKFDLGEKFSLWILNHCSSVFIIISNAVAKKFRNYIPIDKLKVVYQSVNVPNQYINNNYDFFKNGVIKCIILGLIQEGKRQEDAIMAMSILEQAGFNTQLYIVGTGDSTYRKYLNELILEHNLKNNVIFTGFLEDPFSLMKNMDIALICSRSEGFGRVTIEAMKIGKPVIGARSGGTVELIQDGFNGFLYKPKDYNDLAQKIRFLYDNPHLAKNMGERGQEWALFQFSQLRYATDILKIIETLLPKQ